MPTLPLCANPQCPKSQTVIDREEPGKFITIACLTCHSLQIITASDYSTGVRREILKHNRQEAPRPQKYFHG